jgi:hypothetical protein
MAGMDGNRQSGIPDSLPEITSSQSQKKKCITFNTTPENVMTHDTVDIEQIANLIPRRCAQFQLFESRTMNDGSEFLGCCLPC